MSSCHNLRWTELELPQSSKTPPKKSALLSHRHWPAGGPWGMEPKAFEKGDSNRCRNAYEKVLHAALQRDALAPHKKNKCASRRPLCGLPSLDERGSWRCGERLDWACVCVCVCAM